MDYSKLYNQKLTSPYEAVKVVKSGDWIDYGWVIATPIELDKALAERMPDLTDINILKYLKFLLQKNILHGTLGICLV